jgi:hypothetical protein
VLVLNPAEQDQLINRLTRVIEGTAEHFFRLAQAAAGRPGVVRP